MYDQAQIVKVNLEKNDLQSNKKFVRKMLTNYLDLEIFESVFVRSENNGFEALPLEPFKEYVKDFDSIYFYLRDQKKNYREMV